MSHFGLEHEVAFLDQKGQFVDFLSTSFATLQAIIDELPMYAGDEAHLRIGDEGIRVKRWYIEGFERFNEHGELTNCLPKGIEIRTTIHASIEGVIAELRTSAFTCFRLWHTATVWKPFLPAIIRISPALSQTRHSMPMNRSCFTNLQRI